MSGAPDWMFRSLSSEEEQQFRAWARENFKPWSKINEVWHPVVRDECEKINAEKTQQLKEEHGD